MGKHSKTKNRIKNVQETTQSRTGFEWIDHWLSNQDILDDAMTNELRAMLKQVRANNNDPNSHVCICRKCGVDYAPGYGIYDLCPKCNGELY